MKYISLLFFTIPKPLEDAVSGGLGINPKNQRIDMLASPR
jgi:hypothetical protein